MHKAEDASVMPLIANEEASVFGVQKLRFVKDRPHETLS
jgi:hypothetical protein